MSPVHVVLLVITLFSQDPQPSRGDCRDWHECRQLALAAREQQDYERFHDLAWRAVQTGPKNDPALMYLLARAQSLSGRPGDALVMLQRLLQMGTKTDAATNDDFRRVRALPGWAEFEAAVADLTPATAAPAATSPTPTLPASTATVPAPPSTPTRNRPDDAVVAAPKPDKAVAEVPKPAPAEPPRAMPLPAPIESFRFNSSASSPAGIAYDAVSRRFIVGDRDARKLTVVDEFSQHVANLASAQSAGFGQIAALEIDPHQGNLWVVSNDSTSGADAAANGGTGLPHTTLHKLQLISGRVLHSFVPPDRFGVARFADVAITSDSTVLVLDDAGGRIFRLRSKATDFEVAATLKGRPTTIAPASDNLAYVATADGIVVVDLSSRGMTSLKSASGVDLAHISRLRWHKGSLVGIQQIGGTYRAVRFRLDSSGRRATRQQVLDEAVSTIDPTAATISGGILYCLASGDGPEMIIRKITLP